MCLTLWLIYVTNTFHLNICNKHIKMGQTYQNINAFKHIFHIYVISVCVPNHIWSTFSNRKVNVLLGWGDFQMSGFWFMNKSSVENGTSAINVDDVISFILALWLLSWKWGWVSCADLSNSDRCLWSSWPHSAINKMADIFSSILICSTPWGSVETCLVLSLFTTFVFNDCIFLVLVHRRMCSCCLSSDKEWSMEIKTYVQVLLHHQTLRHRCQCHLFAYFITGFCL